MPVTERKLDRAKRTSLIKWNRIRADIPNIDPATFMTQYGGCGFCEEYQMAAYPNPCQRCPLYPVTCSNGLFCLRRSGDSPVSPGLPEYSPSLYWQIYECVQKGDPTGELPGLIDKMIQGIKEAEVKGVKTPKSTKETQDAKI
jgi:hypothetical protein